MCVDFFLKLLRSSTHDALLKDAYGDELAIVRYDNAVDVVVRLHDPTDPSTERTAPLCSAHVQHDGVPRALDPVDDEGEFCQHDSVMMVIMKLSAHGFT